MTGSTVGSNVGRRDTLRVAPFVALLLLSVLPFAVGLNNEFAGDDLFLIFTRLDPLQVVSPGSFFIEDYWGSIRSGLYRPVGLSVLYLERVAFGVSPWPYRVVSICLHSGVVLLLWSVFNRVAGKGPAWAGAALFACHPIHAEAILFAYGQLDLLAAIFLLGSLWLYARDYRLLGTCSVLLAMLSKESALIAPLLAWWMFREKTTYSLRHPAVLSLLAAATYASMKLLAIGTMVVPPEGTVSGGSMGSVLWIKTMIVSAAHAIRLTLISNRANDLLRAPPGQPDWLARS